MKRLSSYAALALAVLAIGCSRGTQVESEPSRAEAFAIDIVGVYDYVASFDSGEHTGGPMTVTRSGDAYAVDFVTDMGEVTTSNVVRTGDTLTMDTMTPGGAGRIELAWQDGDHVTGSVFIGETITIRATRRQ